MAKESPLQISAIDLFVKGADHVVEILHKGGVNFLIFGQESKKNWVSHQNKNNII